MTLYGITAIPLELIDPNPWQTRKVEDPQHVLDLAKSILQDGLLDIPIGRRMDEYLSGRVQLAFGHNRLAAFKLLVEQGNIEFGTMPVNLRMGISDEQMAVLAFTENEKRKDLNPVERANAISAMLHDFGWTQQMVADKLTIDRSSVSNSLRMLRMPADVLTSIAEGCLPVRTAMALLPFYELTPLELTVLERERPDYADFVRLARSGQLNSDTVRITIDIWMKILHPEPAPIPELPLVAVTETIQVLQEEEWDSTPKVGEPHNEELIQIEGNTLTEEPKEEPEEEVKTHGNQPSPVQVEGESKPKPAPAAAPPPAAPEPVVSSDTVLTITWDVTGNAYVGLRRAGEKFPTFTFKANLKAADFPQLLSDLEIE